MRYFAIIAIFLLQSLIIPVSAVEHKSSNDVFLVNFSSAWKVKKSLDPEIVLGLEKGKSFVKFSKLESELSEYYLKARVKEQIESLRAKGSSISGSVERMSIHGKANFYYTSYEAMGQTVYIGFFTYNNASFAVSAKGLSNSGLKRIIYTVRKPGEKIIVAKPKPRKPRVKRRKPKTDNVPDITDSFRGYDDEIDNIMAKVDKSTAGKKTDSAVSDFEKAVKSEKKTEKAAIEKKKIIKKVKPLFERNPAPASVWFVLIALWIVGLFAVKSHVKLLGDPIIPPAPKDVPPDFFFPFLVNRFVTMKDVFYNIITRQKQNLTAFFPMGHEFYFAFAFYGVLFMHIAWSMTALMSSSSAFINVFLQLPFGGFFAAFPEIFFLVPLFMGIYAYFNEKQRLCLNDSLGNMILEMKREEVYSRLRDGKGKEVATLVNQGSFFKRKWSFVDTDDQIVFTIKDEHPEVFIMRKFFGQLGGQLRSRYVIYADDRLAGFVFLDPTSADRFQIHWDYAFSRLAHPAQILMSVLYILSKERDPSYPSIF
ncbi:MAG: hypothetical protein KAJ48_03405 [Elusimicrobiales bacterium]|nr:hypothetical protein [Elusimicrobiales bacterium]